MPNVNIIKASSGDYLPNPTQPFLRETGPYLIGSDYSNDSIRRKRDGSPSFLFTCKESTNWGPDKFQTTSVNRCEFFASQSPIPQNTTIWAAYRQTVLQGQPNLSDWVVCSQFHSTPDAGDASQSPPLSAVLFGDTRWAVLTLAEGQSSAITRFNDFSFERGRRYSHVIKAKFHPTNGSLEWWRDGLKIVDIPSLPMGFDNLVGDYFQFGIYRQASTNTLKILYEDVEISLSSLEHRI